MRTTGYWLLVAALLWLNVHLACSLLPPSDYERCVQAEELKDQTRDTDSDPFYVTPEARCLPQ